MLLHFAGHYSVLPESPRWLLTQGRNKDAVEIMKKVAEINGIAIKDTSALDALSAVSDIIAVKL